MHDACNKLCGYAHFWQPHSLILSCHAHFELKKQIHFYHAFTAGLQDTVVRDFSRNFSKGGGGRSFKRHALDFTLMYVAILNITEYLGDC